MSSWEGQQDNRLKAHVNHHRCRPKRAGPGPTVSCPLLAVLCSLLHVADHEREGRKADREAHEAEVRALRDELEALRQPAPRDTRGDLLRRLGNLEDALKASHSQMSVIDSLIQTGTSLRRLLAPGIWPRLLVSRSPSASVAFRRRNIASVCLCGSQSPTRPFTARTKEFAPAADVQDMTAEEARNEAKLLAERNKTLADLLSDVRADGERRPRPAP